MPRITSEKPLFQNVLPKCCPDGELLAEWLIAADCKYIRKPVCGFCTDCTREYKLKMLAQGRCENPGVEFLSNRHEGVYGVLR